MKKLLFVALFYLLPVFSIFAQSNTYIDSLTAALERDTLSYNKGLILNELATEYICISPKQALDYAQKALKIGQTLHDGDIQAASFRTIASIQIMQDNYVLSLEFLTAALSIFKQSDNQLGIADCYISLGVLYNHEQDFDKALGYLNMAGDIFQKEQKPQRMETIYIRMAESYLGKKVLDTGTHWVEKAWKLHQTKTNQNAYLAHLRNFTWLHFQKRDFEKAKSYGHQLLEKLEEQPLKYMDKEASCHTFLLLAQIAQEEKDFAKAQSYLEEVLKIAHTHNYKIYLRQVYEKLSQLAAQSQDYEGAYWYLQYYLDVQDSVLTTAKSNNLSMSEEIQNVFEIRRELELLQFNQVVNTKTIQSQKQQILLFIGVGVVIIALFCSALISYQKNRLLYAQLEETNALIIAEKQRVERQNQQISRQKEELVRSNKTKDRFFSIVAHDLRSPIGSLVGLVDVICEMEDDVEIEEIKAFAHELRGKLGATLTMTNNLLEWSMSQMNQMTLEPSVFSIKKKIHAISHINHKVLVEKALQMKVNIPDDLLVYADKNQVRTVLRNLIGNAIKFSMPNGKIEIKTQLREQQLQVSVRDHGIGITPAVLPKLFKLEHKYSTEGTAGEKGSGLGLILCQEFITKNGGKIWVESQENVGSTFYFTLPLAKNSKLKH